MTRNPSRTSVSSMSLRTTWTPANRARLRLRGTVTRCFGSCVTSRPHSTAAESCDTTARNATAAARNDDTPSGRPSP